MQCPFQKTGILNYATMKISKLSAIYIVEQPSSQSKPRQFDKQYNRGWTGEESPYLLTMMRAKVNRIIISNQKGLPIICQTSTGRE